MAIKMSNKVEVFVHYSEEDIRKCIEPFWDTMSFGRSFDDYVPEIDFSWYRIEVDGDLAGYFCTHSYTETMACVHVCILPEYRPLKDEIKEAWNIALKKELPKEVDHLIAIIPKTLPHTIVLAVENGWDLIEVYRDQDNLKIFVMGIPLTEFMKREF